MKFWPRIALLLCALAILPAAADTVHIGILAYRPKPEVQQRWQALVPVLQRAMPQHRFVVEAYTFPELQQAVAERRLDFVLTNPGHYVLLARKLGLSAPLATMVVENEGRPMKTFGGVIFTRSDRADLQQLGDLKGKTLAAVSTESLGGYQMQAYELALAGLRLPQDAQLKLTGMPQDQVVQAVLDGSADAGFVRTGVLEAMAREGKIDPAKFKLINELHPPGFPQRVSTRLYPEWAFAALKDADNDIARHIAAELFVLQENKAVTRALGIQGFSVASDYEPVEELLRELRLPPFEQVPNFTFADIWARYTLPLLAGLAAVLLILLLALGMGWSVRRLRQERRKLLRETTLRQSLLNAMGEGVYGVDQDGHCNFMNPAALKLLGYSEQEVLRNNKHTLFHHHREDGTPYPEEECPVSQALKDGQPRSCEDWFWRKDGSGFPVLLTVTPMVHEGEQDGAVVVFRDISEQRAQAERMRHQAQHDALTGLPNRALLMDRLQQALAAARRERHRVALMFIDLDKFKPVNDRLGHTVGDWLLRQAAERMRRCVRDSDTVARIGGDEFMVLLRVVESAEDALKVAEKIRQALVQPFELAEQRMEISCSIGIALYPGHADNERDLFNYADIAMYQAKRGGRDRAQLFVAHD